MTLFPPFLFSLLIHGALMLTGLGLVTLLVLLWRDARSRTIW